MPVTPDPLFVAQGLEQRLAERDADVLDGVMRIDLEVTLGLNLQIHQPVAGDLLQHVLEKGHARLQARRTGAVQIQAYLNLRLQCFATDLGLAFRHFAVRVGVHRASCNHTSALANRPRGWSP